MLAAVRGRYNWKNDNTAVVVHEGGDVDVILHGNRIYSTSVCGGAWFTLAGWNTPTTRSRLRALGVEVMQKQRIPYYKGEAIDATSLYLV